VMDDHEIDDNWQPLDYPHKKNEMALELGRKHYLNFQRGKHMDGEPLYFSFEYNGFPFFVSDTRTARESRTVANVGTRCILGAQQRKALDEWFTEIDPARPAFFISSAMFAPRWRRALADNLAAVHSDGWEGYPTSFNYVLEKIVDRGMKHFVLLSGDTHLSCDATVTLKSAAQSLTLRSIHASSLFAPYPFANTVADDLQIQESVTNHSGARVVGWDVNTQFNPGDGFALLEVSRVNGQWKVDISFDREAQV
jgi:cholesterol oxidase